MDRIIKQLAFLSFAIALFFVPGSEASGRGGSDSVPQFGVASGPQVENTFRGGGWIERKNRGEMVHWTEERSAPRAFRLGADGSIDLSNGMVLFGGVGTHVGLYRGTGFLDPTFSIFGSIAAANGDLLEFVASFSVGTMGDVSATFVFAGGTGRFTDATGQASGPVTLNPDFTFSIDVVGFIDY